MTQAMHDLSVPALIWAIEENRFERFRLFRYWSRAEVHDDPEMLWVLTDLPFGLFNSVLRAQLAPEVLDAAIEAAIARCASRNVPMFWWTGPSTRPANLGAVLEAHGFTKLEESPGMAADLWAMDVVAQVPDGLVVEGVETKEALKQWYRVFHRACGLPAAAEEAWLDSFASIGFGASRTVQFYLGRLDGQPVATSFLILGGGVAGIYGVGTIPEVRGQGIGTALTRAPLYRAREQGYRVGVLVSSDMGFSVYQKIGFRQYCAVGLYRWAAS